MTHKEMQARLDGQVARLRNATPCDNPHLAGSTCSRAWAKGWREAGSPPRHSCECGAPIARSNTTGRCHLCGTRGSKLRPLPADFAEHAPNESNVALTERYGVCADVITRWRKEAGTPADHDRRSSPAVPADFHLVAPSLTKRQLRERYHRADPTINRWLQEAGVEPGRYLPVPPAPVARAPRVVAPANLARANQAAEFLRRFGAVTRCNQDGRFDPDGHCWRRGSAILCAAEIIARAERQGFNADAWREVRAA